MGNVVQAVRLRNKARTLIVSINPLAAINAASAAVRLAGQLVPDFSFDGVIQATSAGESVGTAETTESSHLRMLGQQLQHVIEEAGISLEPAVAIELSPDGTLRVDPSDARAPQIEQAIRGDAELGRTARSAAVPRVPLRLMITDATN